MKSLVSLSQTSQKLKYDAYSLQSSFMAYLPFSKGIAISKTGHLTKKKRGKLKSNNCAV
jgi:hypothetical protein